LAAGEKGKWSLSLGQTHLLFKQEEKRLQFEKESGAWPAQKASKEIVAIRKERGRPKLRKKAERNRSWGERGKTPTLRKDSVEDSAKDGTPLLNAQKDRGKRVFHRKAEDFQEGGTEQKLP